MSLKKRGKEQDEKGTQIVQNLGGVGIIIHFRNWINKNDALTMR